MKSMIIWTEDDADVYGSGYHGHAHTRGRCADVLSYTLRRARVSRADEPDCWALVDALRGEMSDDAREELDACEALEVWTAPDVYWDWCDGDFGLWSSEEDT